jgi:hypothetical protein
MALPIGLHLVYNKDYALTIIELNGAVIRDECLRRQICSKIYTPYAATIRYYLHWYSRGATMV